MCLWRGGGHFPVCFSVLCLGTFVVLQYVQSSAVELKDFYSGLEYDPFFYDGRVDPLEPSRVWLTTRFFGKVVGPIECFGLKVKSRVLYRLANTIMSTGGFVVFVAIGCPTRHIRVSAGTVVYTR